MSELENVDEISIQENESKPIEETKEEDPEDDNRKITLTGKQETALLVLVMRYYASKRKNPYFYDKYSIIAVEERIEKRHFKKFMNWKNKGASWKVAVRAQAMDSYVRDYLGNNGLQFKLAPSKAEKRVVIYLGCGIDNRFQRVDDGKVIWYDLDIADSIDLKQRIYRVKNERYHTIRSDVTKVEWMDTLMDLQKEGASFLFIAEGLFMYVHAEGVKKVFQEINKRFPGSILVADAFQNWVVNNYKKKTLDFAQIDIDSFKWGVDDNKEIEEWGDGIVVDHQYSQQVEHEDWCAVLPNKIKCFFFGCCWPMICLLKCVKPLKYAHRIIVVKFKHEKK